MPTRHADTTWTGGRDGRGEFDTESGAVSGTFTFPTRFEDEPGTNPEELIGAAHSGCFSMQFTALLEAEGYEADEIHTAAAVDIEPAEGGGFEIPHIELTVEAAIPDIDAETFDAIATQAKETCPVSKALAGPTITIDASLAS